MNGLGLLMKRRILRFLPRFERLPVTKVYRRLYWQCRHLYTICTGQGWPRGHFYSPVADIDQVKALAERLFEKDVDLGPSIRLRPDRQKRLLEALAIYYPDFDWGAQRSKDHRYYLDNGLFTGADAVILYAMMRHFAPRRIIEIGSGFSSALMLDTNERFLDGCVQCTFIEPFSSRLYLLMDEPDRERCRIMEKMVQDVPVEQFRELEANDILFVDSSHVSKIGSDVNYLVFEVLPALRSGVIVHFHDILWPFEYPERWVLRLRWSWNEAYLLRAFLQYNDAFEILLFNSFVGYRFADYLQQSMPLCMKYTGGSLWLRKN